MARSLTSADVIIMISVPGLFTTPQRLQGFAVDNIYDSPNRALTETAQGIDGRLSGGFVLNPVDQNFTFQGDSDVNYSIFEVWAATMRQQRTTLSCSGVTTFPSLGQSYAMSNGFLVDGSAMPTAGKIIAQRRYLIRWENVQPNPVG